MKKKFIILLMMSFYCMSLVGCNKKLEIASTVSNTFESGIEMENYWKFYNCKTYGFNVALPEEILKEIPTEKRKEISYKNDDFEFSIKERTYSKTNWDYLTENYTGSGDLNAYGQFLFEKDYYGNYSLNTYNDEVLTVTASTFNEKTQMFGYKIYISNKKEESACEVTFMQKMNNTNLPNFYNYAETANTFIESFYLTNYEEAIDVEYINELSDIRENVMEEYVLIRDSGKDISSKINNGEEITFEEYAAFLESWGTYEKEAFQSAYEAGYVPKK